MRYLKIFLILGLVLSAGACATSAPVGKRALIVDGEISNALNGNTLFIDGDDDRVYMSSRLWPPFRAKVGSNFYRYKFGLDIETDYGFIALYHGQEIAGIAASHQKYHKTFEENLSTSVIYLVETKDTDRGVYDFAALPRRMRAIFISGFDEHLSCKVTAWKEQDLSASPQNLDHDADTATKSCVLYEGRLIDGRPASR